MEWLEKFGMKERHYVLVTGLAGPKLRTYPGEVKDGRFVYSAPLLAGKVLQPVKDTKGKGIEVSFNLKTLGMPPASVRMHVTRKALRAGESIGASRLARWRKKENSAREYVEGRFRQKGSDLQLDMFQAGREFLHRIVDAEGGTKRQELSEFRGVEKTSRQEEQTTRDYGIYYKTGAKKAERNAPVDAEEKAEWRSKKRAARVFLGNEVQPIFAPQSFTKFLLASHRRQIFAGKNVLLQTQFHTINADLMGKGLEPARKRELQKRLGIAVKGGKIVQTGNPVDFDYLRAETPELPARVHDILMGVAARENPSIKTLEAAVDWRIRTLYKSIERNAFLVTTPNGREVQQVCIFRKSEKDGKIYPVVFTVGESQKARVKNLARVLFGETENGDVQSK